MDGFIDYYELLQVHPGAEPEVIDKAYKALVLKHHPDRGGDPERVRLIIEAYGVLCDPARRLAYDQTVKQHAEAGAPTARSYLEDVKQDLRKTLENHAARLRERLTSDHR